MAVFYLVLSVLLLFAAHLIRIVRWQLFIEVYEKPNLKNLMQSLSLGYFVSYLIPFKLGDIVRAWVAGDHMKNGKALGFSTVIVDRYLDIVCVGLLFAGLTIWGIGDRHFRQMAIFYMIVAIAGVAILVGIFAFKRIVKKGIREVAGIFNEKIEANILMFFWALICNFKDIFQKINKSKLVATTLLMWGFYLGSYALFAQSLQSSGGSTTWHDVFMLLFSKNGIRESTSFLTLSSDHPIILHPVSSIVYALAPIIFLFLLSFLAGAKLNRNNSGDNYLNLQPHLNSGERLDFLENYFADNNRSYIKMYLEISQGISIIRDFSAGSNATTMLCMDSNHTFFRKYAFGNDGEKLYQQVQWIESYKDLLPLPEILRQIRTAQYCYYDMPYNSSAVGLFEYTHSMPVDKTWDIITRVLDTLENSIYQVNVRNADKTTIDKYLSQKVERNLKKICDAPIIKDLQQYDSIIINGVSYPNLSTYKKFLSKNYLEKIFSKDRYSVIHGDLTIENIICTRIQDGRDDFYIIDPNTGNIHDSPNLDYGKLLQSIHGGYEFLMATQNVKYHENHIDFLFTRSSVYKELHTRLRKYMEENFGRERTRSIYFHEIIHWLRLMPYKIEKDEDRALLFYAGMLMVIHDVIQTYGDKDV